MASRTQVYRITSAQVGLSKDQQSRARRYMFSMGLRTLCFIGAVFTEGWLRWVLVAGAVILPYLAVVIANGGREPTRDSDDQTSIYVQPGYQRALTAGEPEPR